MSASHGRHLQQWGEDCWGRSCRRRTEIQSVGLVMQSTAQTPHCHWCGVGEETAREDSSRRHAPSSGKTREGAISDGRQWKEGLFRWKSNGRLPLLAEGHGSNLGFSPDIEHGSYKQYCPLLGTVQSSPASCSSVAVSALSS